MVLFKNKIEQIIVTNQSRTGEITNSQPALKPTVRWSLKTDWNKIFYKNFDLIEYEKSIYVSSLPKAIYKSWNRK